MKTEQSHIVETAGWVCAQFGLKSTTMDDIAHHSGISKKTLYLYFENKKTLIKKIVQNLVDHDELYLRASPGISPDAAIEMMDFFQYIQNKIGLVTTHFIWDLKKYYPEAYSLLEQFKKDILIPFINQNIIRGVYEGLYRPDINMSFTGDLYLWQLQHAMEDGYLQNNQRREFLKCLNVLFLNGIINESGRQTIAGK